MLPQEEKVTSNLAACRVNLNMFKVTNMHTVYDFLYQAQENTYTTRDKYYMHIVTRAYPTFFQ